MYVSSMSLLMSTLMSDVSLEMSLGLLSNFFQRLVGELFPIIYCINYKFRGIYKNRTGIRNSEFRNSGIGLNSEFRNSSRA